MAYQSDYRRGRNRDEESEREFTGSRRGSEEGWSSRGQYGETYGRGFEEGRPSFGQRGFEQPSGQEIGRERYGQSFGQPGYGLSGYDPSGQGFARERYGPQRYGQGFGQQEFGRGSEDWRSSARYGPGWSEAGRGFGQTRYGQHGGYSEEGGYDPQHTQGAQPQSGMGGGFRESVGSAGEGYRQSGESYGRRPEGFDRETGTYRGFGRYAGSPEITGEWEGFGGTRSYGAGFEGPRFGTLGRTRGRFTGRGPKGYSRSDERVREDVSDRLEQHGEIDASDIEVVVVSGEVTLEGTVDDRRTKRLAEDVIDDLPGVKQVNNRLRVKGNGGEQGERRPTTGGTSGASMEGTERAKGGSTTKSSTRT